MEEKDIVLLEKRINDWFKELIDGQLNVLNNCPEFYFKLKMSRILNCSLDKNTFKFINMTNNAMYNYFQSRLLKGSKPFNIAALLTLRKFIEDTNADYFECTNMINSLLKTVKADMLRDGVLLFEEKK